VLFPEITKDAVNIAIQQAGEIDDKKVRSPQARGFWIVAWWDTRRARWGTLAHRLKMQERHLGRTRHDGSRFEHDLEREREDRAFHAGGESTGR